MFGLGWGEILILGLIAIVLVGPKQFPEVMKGLAKMIREFSKAREEWMNTVRTDDEVRDIHESYTEVKDSIGKPFRQLKKSIEDEIRQQNLEEALDEMTEVYDQKDKQKIKIKDEGQE